MCGSAGAIGFIDPDVVEAVQKMNMAQIHRGPDDEGIWSSLPSECGLGVVLAHRRLAIIDLSADGHQPMIDPSTGAVIVYNGEVYNYRDLRSELESHGAQFSSKTDTEVVLKAYTRWGADCVRRFRGMFAFAIWDPANRHLFLARDRVGIKPLYLCQIDRGRGRRTLLFASEVRALLASGMVPRQLDPEGLATYAWNGFVMGPGTIVRNVRSVPSGAIVTIDLEQLTVVPQHFWHIPSGDVSPGCVGELRKKLAEAVQIRLLSDVPLGVFLSGGVDSSAIAALATRNSPAMVRTFNIGFEEATYDESPYALAVANCLGTDHTQLCLTQHQFRTQLNDALNSIDQPTFDQINTYFISRAAREAGITVALAGIGGDELFGGYSSFVDLPRAARWARRSGFLPRPILRVLTHAVARWKVGRFGPVPPQVRWGKLWDVLATRGRMPELYQVGYGLFCADFYRQLLLNGLSGTVRYGLSEAKYAELSARISGNQPLHTISILELACFVGERLLRDADAASMAVSLELRVPLLDHQVIEAVAAVEPQRRYMPLQSKRLLRDMATDGIDPSIFDRPKAGFVLPIDIWIRHELKDEVGATLLDRATCEAAGLNPDKVAQLWQAFQEGAPGIYWSRVWALFVLLWWCRRHCVSV